MHAAYNARGSFVMLASAEEGEDRSIGIGGREGALVGHGINKLGNSAWRLCEGTKTCA